MVQIVPYTAEYEAAFRDLNLAWIEKFFVVEASDRRTLYDPQQHIIDKGGFIFIALYEGKAVGACAGVKTDDPRFDYELSKMAVDPGAQGLGIGYQLAQAVLDKAKALGATNVYLESNSKLLPALKLYQKLGFVYLEDEVSHYDRADVFMLKSL